MLLNPPVLVDTEGAEVMTMGIEAGGGRRSVPARGRQPSESRSRRTGAARAAAVIAAAAATFAANAAYAQTSPTTPQYTESYSGSSLIPVSNIITANSYPDGSFGDTQFGAAISPATYSFSDPFLKDATIFNSRTFFFGESPDTIISAASQTADVVADPEHLIVAMELGNSQAAIGQDFSTVFPNAPTEIDILTALDTVYDGR